VADNGRGLNLEKVKSKAVEREVITAEQAASMSDKEAEMLIFRSGLSTKDQATDLSGRGVGMDVVLTNLKKWNGEVIINNNPGQGLAVGLRLPITNTLLTKEAILLRVGASVFCLPLEYVSEIVTVPLTAIHHHKDGAVFRHRDMVISVINIKEILGLGFSDYSADSPAGESRAFVILQDKAESRQSIMADEVLGQQKIVIKAFELDTFRKLPYFNGLTLLGDGRVVLILDSEKFLTS
jgi:two-component system chemotaxis sensor kinase CheA